MATSLRTDMKYLDPYAQTGYSEVIAQKVDAFNSASKGTIRLRSARKPGDYDYKSFFTNAGGLVARQDQTSVSAATAIKLAQEQEISVKLNRKIGPVDWARSAFLKPGLDDNAFRLAAGEQAAVDAVAEMLNSGLRAARAALANQANNLYTVGSSGTLATAGLISGLAKMGDRAERVACWIMHSKQYYDLVQSQVTANIVDVSGFNVATGTPVTLGRPVVVTDSDSLVVVTGSGSAAVTDYFALGLVADGIIVEETEEEYITFDEVTGLEQLVRRMQGEFAFNLGLKGFKWDVTNGGLNPSSSAVGTGSNWDKVFTSAKDLAGIVVKSR